MFVLASACEPIMTGFVSQSWSKVFCNYSKYCNGDNSGGMAHQWRQLGCVPRLSSYISIFQNVGASLLFFPFDTKTVSLRTVWFWFLCFGCKVLSYRWLWTFLFIPFIQILLPVWGHNLWLYKTGPFFNWDLLLLVSIIFPAIIFINLSCLLRFCFSRFSSISLFCFPNNQFCTGHSPMKTLWPL